MPHKDYNARDILDELGIKEYNALQKSICPVCDEKVEEKRPFQVNEHRPNNASANDPPYFLLFNIHSECLREILEPHFS